MLICVLCLSRFAAAKLPGAFESRFGYKLNPHGLKLKDLLEEAAAGGFCNLHYVRARPHQPPILMVTAVSRGAVVVARKTPDSRFHQPRPDPAHVMMRELAVAQPRPGPVEVVISFDTTGSMYGYLEEVRWNLQRIIRTLTKRVPGIKIGVIAHGKNLPLSALSAGPTPWQAS